MRDVELVHGVYGAPPAQLAQVPVGARQLSPLSPGSDDLAAARPGSFASIVMLAATGTLERRSALAEALVALSPGGALIVMAPNNKGGTRLAAELEAFGCDVEQTSKSHHRICATRRPDVLTGVDEAIEAGALRRVEAIGLWSQPGVFSWDRIDPGSNLLAARLPQLQGRGADLGCGIGTLAIKVLTSPDVTRLDLVDIDRRAVAAARRNVADEPRAHFHWADAADAASGEPHLAGLDFVVMNPPFHISGTEDKGVGQAFIRKAAKILRIGGALWIVANRHLPYEAVLRLAFKSVRLDHEAGGFKIYEAIK
jgi:16S rRNA (guanine1207-N2)-methyltransferase